MKTMLIPVVLIAGLMCTAIGDTKPIKRMQTCGGWENWLTIIVTQEDQSKCSNKIGIPNENCLHVLIQVHPGDPKECTFQYDVVHSKVDNVVKQFVEEYMP